MEEKYLSVITNFGCHYTCPYCIVRENNLHVPQTTIEGLSKLEYYIKDLGANIVSVSGGGDPLYAYDKHTDWYRELFKILEKNKCKFELHTSYFQNEDFPTEKCERIVYHLREPDDIKKVHKRGEKFLRVVYVIQDRFTKDDIEFISEFYKKSKEIDELSFRQRVDKDFQVSYYLHEFLLAGHKKDWFYIQQHNYNTYYAENEIHKEFVEFK